MQKMILLLAVLLVSVANTPILKVHGTVYDQQGNPLSGVLVEEQRTHINTRTDQEGKYTLEVKDEKSILLFTKEGYAKEEIKIGSKSRIDIILMTSVMIDEELVIEQAPQESIRSKLNTTGAVSRSTGGYPSMGNGVSYAIAHDDYGQHNTESYDAIEENIFHRVKDKPLSTFSIDVDAASYSNVRRFLNMGQLPPKDAVRIEEMINYFNYQYEGPTDEHPFAIHTGKMEAPWNEDHVLVKVGIQGKRLDLEEMPPSNVVFLLDVSGSMNAPNKLPLLKSSLKMLTNELRPIDKISIVVYAGAAGLVLPPTSGADKKTIVQALENLEAGGSTAGGAGIQLAYEVVKKNFVDGGNNRVVLATDGDFNVGVSSNAQMQRLIEEKREEGVFLTVLGFGTGNYKDSRMEILADKGNGNYAYIDNILEAKKVLVTEFGGTLFTIAKDVKIQVEFNPNVVQAYRLIGYENRILKDEDFNDDKKDAGELGSGHTVTALYEIIPVGVESPFMKHVDELKYQESAITGNKDELMTVKFRYKEPNGTTSKLITKALANDDQMIPDANLSWAAAVSGFGMLLRDSEFKGNMTFPQVLSLAKKGLSADEYGYRSEFVRLVEVASQIQ